MFIINTFSTCFRHYYAHLQENKTCVTARGVLHWFCWMWLVAVVGRCVVGCEHHGGYCLTQCYNAAPHNRYQPHPAEPAQHTTCSNTRLVLLKMGIMMPETCWESVANKHLTFASFGFLCHFTICKCFIQSFHSLSYGRSLAFGRASSVHNAMQSIDSSCKFQCLLLLWRQPAAAYFSSVLSFLQKCVFRRQFLRMMWPMQSAFLPTLYCM